MAEARFKYPRTPHLPWSEGRSDDDKAIPDTRRFEGRDVVVTEKRDGENTTLYPDNVYHARSIDGRGRDYQSWIARMWSERHAELPSGFRVCGENLFARHSVGYDRLESFFEVFAIVDPNNRRISWREIEEWCARLRLATVPVLHRGPWNERQIRDLWSRLDPERTEGYVVSVADAFEMDRLGENSAKFVRRGHVQSSEHWTKNWKPNRLRTSVEP